MASSRKLLWVRFSFRTLLLAVLVIAALFAYVANQARKNDHLIARARSTNADLEFAAWGPDWMRRWMGDQYLRQPVAIYVPQDFVEGCLPILRDVPSIKTLAIVDFVEYTDVHWRQIEKVARDVEIRHLNSNEFFANSITCTTYESGSAEFRPMINLLKQIPPSRATPSVSLSQSMSGVRFSTLHVPLNGRELQLYVFEHSVIVLADGQHLIDYICPPGRTYPAILDVDGDRHVDIGISLSVHTPNLTQHLDELTMPTFVGPYQITADGFQRFDLKTLLVEQRHAVQWYYEDDSWLRDY